MSNRFGVGKKLDVDLSRHVIGGGEAWLNIALYNMKAVVISPLMLSAACFLDDCSVRRITGVKLLFRSGGILMPFDDSDKQGGSGIDLI